MFLYGYYSSLINSPTSNITCGTFASLPDHIFALYYQHDHPLSICTDDSGVFQITLSSEYAALAKAFHLSQQDIETLCYNSISYIFTQSQTMKQRLIHCFELYRQGKKQSIK